MLLLSGKIDYNIFGDYMRKMLKIVMIISLFMTCTGCGGQQLALNKIKDETELPIIHVITEKQRDVNKVTKMDSKATIEVMNSNGYDFSMKVNADGEYPITIKGRGNSSWTMPTGKKPFNIKFSEKVDLLGLGEGKKWSLIASWTDTSFMRNYISFNLAKVLDENTPDCAMVELVINGKYEGIYLLCEAYQIKENRVETLGDGKDLNGDGEITEYLIEADARAMEHNEPNRMMTPSNYWMVIKEPDEDVITTPTDNRYVYASEYINKVDKAIVNLDGYEELIDVDSLANMYVINEYLKNPDYGYGNQPYYASTFMYMEEGGKLCFGPVWDCDLSMGRNDYREIELEAFRDSYTPEGMLAGNTHWINQLLKDESFVKKVEEKWEILKPYIKEMMETKAPEMIEKISKTQALDFKTWDETNEDRTTEWSYRIPYTFEEECKYILDFMEKRFKWMDDLYGK